MSEPRWLAHLKDFLHRTRTWFTCYVPQLVRQRWRGESWREAHRQAAVFYRAFCEQVETWDL